MAITDNIETELKKQNAVLLSHYYVASELQNLADNTKGIVSDSLEMARFGKNSDADTLLIAGVRFMGETAKILSPEKTVLVLDDDATCSLDISCPVDKFSSFCNLHPEREVVVYANTSAEVKAISDWVVTSGSAISVVKHLTENGKKIIWAPDKHLGDYVKKQTNADMIIWDGACIVHEGFKKDALLQLKNNNPDAAILVHPESPKEIIALADVVGSTTALIKAVVTRSEDKFIVATDNGIFYKMHQAAPNKTFMEAPNMGISATCESCAHCKWMAMNTLEKCLNVLKNKTNKISINADIIKKAQQPINRLLNFTKK